MRNGRLLIGVSFDPDKGYTAAHPGFAGAPALSAVSLRGLRQAIAAVMAPDKIEIVLNLDKLARKERDSRRRGGQSRASDYARAR